MKNLSSKIAKSNNVNGSTPKNADYAMAIWVLKGHREYTNYSTGSGKWSGSNDRFPERYLKDWGIDFQTGNDAPRGGKAGNYIELSKKGMLQTKVYRAEVALQLAKEKAERLEALANVEAKKEISRQEIIKNIKENSRMFENCKKELAELKEKGNKAQWQILANSLVQTACKNDFSLGWSNIYKLIQNA